MIPIVDLEFALAILDKLATPMVKKIAQISAKQWNKFKVDFKLAFCDYTTNAYEKHSKIKTILYSIEPQPLYEVFEVPSLQKKRAAETILARETSAVTNLSHFILLEGNGGIGKSMLLKHLYLSALTEKMFIPIFVELREINELKDDYKIEELILSKIMSLDNLIQKQCFEYALETGCFLFLLDGYDEIKINKQEAFIRKLEAFCDRFAKNHFIMSSRPSSEFIEFQRFTVLTARPFSLQQACSLVQKTRLQEDLKKRFLADLKTKLYDKHRSFASNPLLLNIMLLTYDNYAEIPQKLHLFYSNAFETLYYKHDATKGGYRREQKCKLAYNEFRNVFASFCFLTYSQGKYEFSHDEIEWYLSKIIQISDIKFQIEDYIFDLVGSLCVICREGIYYRFVHRSFQEYFCAVFLKELPDNQMTQIAIRLIEQDFSRAINDSVFNMLLDMNPQRFESNILLPILEMIEKDAGEDQYLYYLKKIVPAIDCDLNEEDDLEICLIRGIYDFPNFAFNFTFFYRDKDNEREFLIEQADQNLIQYIEETNDSLNKRTSLEDIISDPVLYELVRLSWVGDRIMQLINFKQKIMARQQKSFLDLSELIRT